MVKEQLSEKEELLLMKALDGEGSFVEDLRAKWLLKRSTLARDFVRLWGKVRTETVSELDSRVPVDLDLWPRIAQRIEQEQRAELFLGKRTFKAERVWFRSPALGLAGASMAAAALMFLVLPRGESLLRSGGLPQGGAGVALQNNVGPVSQLEPVAFSGAETQHRDRPQIIERGVPEAMLPQTMEVDWMRSDGRLKVIPMPSGQGGIIWVKRKNGSVVGVPSSVVRRSNPETFDVAGGLSEMMSRTTRTSSAEMSTDQ